MSPALTPNCAIAVLLLCSAFIFLDAQKQRRKLSRSPFQPQGNQDFQKVSSPFDKQRNSGRNSRRINPLQSPFTPPNNIVREVVTTRRPQTTTTSAPPPPPPPVVDNSYDDQFYQEEVVPAGSPFTPPPQAEWRQRGQWKPKENISPWLNALEERQKENAESIPSISNIDINNSNVKRGGGRGGGGGGRRRFRGRPRVSVYQDNSHHRDIHDAGPGVTPWTRYTEKPRLSNDNSGPVSGRFSARCGKMRYSPRNQICCSGQVSRRRGMSPACCGTKVYDTVFSKCCDKVISIRSGEETGC